MPVVHILVDAGIFCCPGRMARSGPSGVLRKDRPERRSCEEQVAWLIAVLLVGPEVAGLPELRVTAELLRVGDLRGVQLTPLVGPEVTAARLVDRLERQRYDVILWSGHGTASRLLLSDGKAVHPQWLASQLVRHGAPLVVLAACESAMRPDGEALTLGFQDVLPAAGITLVAMSSNVTDAAAIEYDVSLLQALVAGAAIRQAHEAGLEAAALAKAATAPQLFVADAGRDMTYTTSGSDQLLRTMSDKIDRLGEQVNTINTKQVLLEATLQADMRRVQAEVTMLRQDVATWRQGSFSLPKPYVGILVLFMLVTLAVLVAVSWRSL